MAGYFEASQFMLLRQFKWIRKGLWLIKKRYFYQHLKKLDMPLVSIIMPNFNGASTLKLSIDSLLKQTYQHIEIIIIDDNSNDSSWDILSEYSNNPKICIIRNKWNKGAAYSRNHGIVKARGQYVTFQDSDDVALPDRIAKQLYPLITNKKKVFSFCNLCRVSEDNSIYEINGRVVSKAIVSMMFEREKVISEIGFFMVLRRSEDTEYFERLISFYGASAASYIFEVLYFAKLRVNSLTFSDGDYRQVGPVKIEHQVSAKTKADLDKFRRFHTQIELGVLSPYISFRA
ncbi:glycosyltransferase DcbF [Catenovulum agarivorans DS-2]|uniref:Glycosyltransferase DcbF n=1 Tax=Catenovulum agarivorans DS-2 TaxID=1328313 RepID=W7QMV9_9ALTE|nr:glycosyltransferase family 2 protein [Catenovulum agarivorans]EWH10282.1 glycosyltransferase DcbF [Catenovulum agarivorans DS-2]